jgi:glycosyltransferase involved in cell wall biosynthesis
VDTAEKEPAEPGLPRPYRRACKLAEQGRYDEARRHYVQLEATSTDPRLKALVANDLAALSALDGDLDAARTAFQAALTLNSECEPARLNAALLQAELTPSTQQPITAGLAGAALPDPPAGPVRVAILSFLFNWPSTGGGTVHTAELARFLAKGGYEVRHLYARHPGWGVGRVETPTAYPSEAIEFDDASWNVPAIQARFRQAVDAFVPDHVIITDSWNMKPLLAEAVRAYPYILRFQAMECLCPLNNVRLLPEPGGSFRQCPLHQLASPAECARCVAERGHLSGSLHQAERALSGVGTAAYHERLVRAIREAEAVLVVNPLTEAMVSPYAKCVRVVTAGMDPERFPWPPPERVQASATDARTVLLFAGLVEEWMKGYGVLHDACERLWQKRQDFELVATGEPASRVDEFTRFIGWQSQENLPAHLYAADVLVMPTIAQEALGRTAVEAMAAGRPVVASRIGGLPFTVADGATGLLCEPGDAVDLAHKIETLLDDPDLRERMGRAGRRRFEEHYTWDVIVERHYRPLLKRRNPEPASRTVFAPRFPDRVDREALIEHAARFFGLGKPEVEAKFQTYRSFHDAKGYARSLGEFKTLCLEEAFLLYVTISRYRPRTIVEVGTQHGKSTRRILDMINLLGLGSRVVCFDRTDEVRHFDRREVELVLGDLTGRFRQEVLKAHKPQLVFLDVHTHGLLREAITETLADAGDCVLAIHDCGRGLCNPHMTLTKDDLDVTSLTGVWERHILAEVFGVAGPLNDQLDEAASPTHRMRIFDTPHGLALIVPETMGTVVPHVLSPDPDRGQ